MACDHFVEFFPVYKPDPKHPHKWWRFWEPNYVTYHWYCWKCGVEMEPVFREKNDGSPA